MSAKKYTAEAIGTFWLTFAGCGSAVLAAAFPQVGIGLLGVAAIKALIWDMASVAAEWRVASFIGVGLLMLGVAVGYAKVSAKLEREAKKNQDAEPPMPPVVSA